MCKFVKFYKLTQTLALALFSNQSITNLVFNANECCICMERASNCVINPCGHVCICSNCRDKWRSKLPKCPICQREILSVFCIYLWINYYRISNSKNVNDQMIHLCVKTTNTAFIQKTRCLSGFNANVLFNKSVNH